MSKTKSAFFCQSCGYESAKWVGKCPSCNNWNTFVEEIIDKGAINVPTWKSPSGTQRLSKPSKVEEIQSATEERVSTGDLELDRVLGGGTIL